MRGLDILIVVILAGITTLTITSVVIFHKEPKVVEVHDIKLTDEEMARRPIMVNEPKEEVIEEIETEVYIPDNTFLYDIIPLDGETQLLTQRLCEQYHVGYAFFIAMLESESAFNPDVNGDGGSSVGYMQINKPNWDRYGLNAFVPAENLEIGIRMMGELLEKYQEFDMVVMCYKAGEGKAAELKENGIRLKACDQLAGSTIWWETKLAECRGE